ncbi:MAG: S8 family serine peptidase, partial [bacterium]
MICSRSPLQRLALTAVIGLLLVPLPVALARRTKSVATNPASALIRAEKTTVVDSGKIAITLKAGESRTRLQSLAKSLPAKSVKPLEHVGVLVVRPPQGWSNEDAISYYRSMNGIKSVELLVPRILHAPVTPPNDRRFNEQWYHLNTGQPALGTFNDPSRGVTVGADVKTLGGWASLRTSPEIVIAYIDTGLDLQHPDLQGILYTNAGEIPDNGIDDDDNGFVDDVHGWDFVGSTTTALELAPDNDPADEDGHGTFGAGLVGARGDNGIGIAGITGEVKIMPLKIGDNRGNLSTEALLEAYDYAIANGAQIMNLSLGGTDFLQAELEALSRANDAGVLVVASAGNDSLDIDDVKVYPAAYNLPNIVAVGATGRSDRLTDFSNFGARSVDLLAPGEGIVSTVPNYDPNSSFFQNTRDFAFPAYDDDRNGFAEYGYLKGTSFSAPLVSGALALVRARFPALTPLEAREHLLRSTDFLEELSPALSESQGRLNLEHALEGRIYLQRVEPRSVGPATSQTLRLLGVGFDGGESLTLQEAPGVSVAALQQISRTELEGTLLRSPDSDFARRALTVSSPNGSSSTLPSGLVLRPEPHRFADTANVEIPDSVLQGIERQIVVDEALTIDDLEVGINIRHPYRGDLQAHLVSPQGEIITLFNRPGGGDDPTDDMVTTFPVGFPPASSFAAVRGLPARGTWHLFVADDAPLDKGTLVSWGLNIYDFSKMQTNFAGETSGWTQSTNFFGFDPVGFDASPGQISLVAPSGANAYGLWQGTPDALSPMGETLYILRPRVRALRPTGGTLPLLRLRVSRQDFQWSAIFWRSEGFNERYLPGANFEELTEYFITPQPPHPYDEGTDDLRSYFEMGSFGAEDHAGTHYDLSNWDIERRWLGDLGSATTIIDERFTTNTPDLPWSLSG